MHYHCTQSTDLDELVGHDSEAGFCYGPMCDAMRGNEELVLDESDALSLFMVAKLATFLNGVFIPETGEYIKAPAGFKLVLG